MMVKNQLFGIFSIFVCFVIFLISGLFQKGNILKIIR